MTRITLICCLAISALLLNSCANAEKDREKADLHMRIGTAYLNQGNYPLALRELLEARKLDSSNPVIANNLALAYYVRGKYKEAEKYFLEAIDLDSKYTEAVNNLGRLYIDMGRHKDAVRELEKALKDLTYPTPEKPHTNLGLAHLKVGNYSLAQRNFKAALKANHNFCPAHNLYGQTFFQMKEYKKASLALDSALQVCPNFDEVQYYGALSYLKIGQTEKGLARLRELVDTNPSSQYTEKARAVLLEQDRQ